MELKLARALYESNYFDIVSDVFLYTHINEGSCDIFSNGNVFLKQHLTEAKLKDWVKNQAEKIKSKANSAKDKTLSILAKVMGSFKTFIKFIVNNIKKFLSGAWKVIKNDVFSNLDNIKNKVVSDAKKIVVKDNNKQTLKTEIKHLSTLTTESINFIVDGIVGKLESDTKSMGDDKIEEGITECVCQLIVSDNTFIDDILESTDSGKLSLPGLSKVASKIAELPFFKQIHAIEHKVETFSNAMLTNFSTIMSKLLKDVKPHKFKIMGMIAGIVAGYKVKDVLYDVSKMLVKLGKNASMILVANAFPILGKILKLMLKVAKVLWLVGVGETVLTAVVGVDNVVHNGHTTPQKTNEFKIMSINEYIKNAR